MADQPIKYNSQIEKDEHDDSANIGGKRVILHAWNPNTLKYERVTSSGGVLDTSGSGGSGASTTTTYNATPITLTDTQTAPLQSDSHGYLKVNVVAGGAGGGAATVADGADVAEGTTTDTAVVGDNAGTLSAKLRGINKALAASLPLPTNAAKETGGNLDSIATNIGAILTTSDFDTKVGSLTETAPTTDTASSGLNGRLQRIAQRLTSLIALLPTALGAGGGLKVDGSGTALPISGTVTANAGTNLNTSTLAVESGGNLATLAGIVSSSKAAVKMADGDLATLGAKTDAKSTATDGTSVSLMSVLKEISAMCQAPASTPVTGTFWQSTQPVSLASLPALATGSNVIGHVIVDSGTITAVTAISNALPAGTNLMGKVGIDQTTPGTTNGVSVQATANGGYTPGKLNSAASTNATSVKASAGTLGFLSVTNTNAAVRYLKFYNKASAPTVGTDTPVLTIAIPGNTAGAGNNPAIPAAGLNFSTGIAFAITTGAADSDTGAVALNEVIVNYGTK